jgi:hypothetical protein
VRLIGGRRQVIRPRSWLRTCLGRPAWTPAMIMSNDWVAATSIRSSVASYDSLMASDPQVDNVVAAAFERADPLGALSARPDYWRGRLLSFRCAPLYEPGRLGAQEALDMATPGHRDRVELRRHVDRAPDSAVGDRNPAGHSPPRRGRRRSSGSDRHGQDHARLQKRRAGIRRAENALLRGGRARCVSTGRRLLDGADELCATHGLTTWARRAAALRSVR